MSHVLINAQIVLPDSIIPHGWILIEGDIIAGYGSSDTRVPHAQYIYDVNGHTVMPGFIDLHCDTIEKQVQPRPNVMIDTTVALHSTDRIMCCSGITTEYHSLSLDDAEFGVRNDEFVRNFISLLHTTTQHTIHHAVHARVEVSSERGVDTLRNIIDSPLVKLVSIMDHSPGQGQYVSEELFRQYVAKTTGRNLQEIDDIIEKKQHLKAGIPQRINEVIDLCRQFQIPIATHDDDTPEKIQHWVEQGIYISEFPTTMDAAQAAHAAGIHVGMGAPNVLRGQSSGGNVSAIEAIQRGCVDWLCSDYYPAALLPAIYKLVDMRICTLNQAVNMVSFNPACAVGIQRETGSIQVGLRADLIVVARISQPVVVQTFVNGQPTLTTQTLRRSSTVAQG